MKNLLLTFIIFFSFKFTFAQIEWTRYADNPVLDVGLPGEWDDGGIFKASVYFDGAMYHMWYGGYDGANIRIGYATSPDGINWQKYSGNPVLDLGAPGTWEDNYAFMPSVIYFNGQFHMIYQGNDSDNNRIGHATSPDGINWTKDPQNPVIDLGDPGSWNSNSVSMPFVMSNEDTLHLWFSGADGSYTIRIGHAFSTDTGTSWQFNPNNPVLDVGAWDPRVWQPCVVYNDITYEYYMLYGGGSTDFDSEIGYATSLSLYGPWEKQSSGPIFLKGAPGTWDSQYVGFHYIIFDPSSNTYKMWYTGGAADFDGKIGYATAIPLPVELTSFTASTSKGKVYLNWSTATETNNYGFEIERKIVLNQNQGEWVRIAFAEGQGTTTEPKEYSYIDDISSIQATTLVYRLKQMDFLGTYEYSNEVFVENPAPVDYVLYQNYPNPFNPTTTITFGIPVKTYVVLKVFNAVGEEVAQLYNGEKEAGRYIFEFNAEGLPSGVYFYRIQSGDFIDAKKMLVLK